MASRPREIEAFCSEDGRLIAVKVLARLSSSYPSMAESRDPRDAHSPHRYVITSDDLPLQVVYLHPDAGWRIPPHVHPPIEPPRPLPRHQVLVCTAGSVRVGCYTAEGDHLTDVELTAGDLILLCEGHSVEALEAGTRLIEIRQGPVARGSQHDIVML